MLGRRTLLKLLTIATLLPLGGGLLYRLGLRVLPVKPLRLDEKQVIRALVDLILPRDELTPGAVDLEVDAAILDQAKSDPDLRRLLRQGIHWLHDQAGASVGERFLSLSKTGQIALLERAEAADYATVENHLFQRMRNLIFELYYSKPQAWSGLCYTGPPQPRGFIDYQSPPREC